MNNINLNLTTELCAEDRARIDKLTAAAEGLIIMINQSLTTQTEKTEKVEIPEPDKNTAEPESIPVKEEPTESEPETTDDETTNAEETPKHTQAELQSKVISLVSAGKKEEVKKIIVQYAPNVSAIPAEKINEVWGKLDKLEG